MFQYKIFIIFALSGTVILPASSITRWFSSSYRDVRVTLNRLSGCSSRAPIKEGNLTEVAYFAKQFNHFLDQAQLSNDQLESVRHLAGSICVLNSTNDNADSSYPISNGLNVWKFTHMYPTNSTNYTEAMKSRCQSLNFVMDELYDLFKSAALNSSAPLNFKSRNYSESEAFYQSVNLAQEFRNYHLIDLINTIWIKSDLTVDHVCNVTIPISSHITDLIRTSKPDDRSAQQTSLLTNLINFVDRYLDPILGFQRRLYWQGNNVFEAAQDHFSHLRGAVGGFLKSTGRRIAGTFRGSNNSNSTLARNSTVRSTNSTVSVRS